MLATMHSPSTSTGTCETPHNLRSRAQSEQCPSPSQPASTATTATSTTMTTTTTATTTSTSPTSLRRSFFRRSAPEKTQERERMFTRSTSIPPRLQRNKVLAIFHHRERHSLPLDADASSVSDEPSPEKDKDKRGGTPPQRTRPNGPLHLRALLTSPRRRPAKLTVPVGVVHGGEKVVEEMPEEEEHEEVESKESAEELAKEKTHHTLSHHHDHDHANVHSQHEQDDLGLDDLSGLEIAYIDEEAEVPAAPSACDKRAELVAAETRARALQLEVDTLREMAERTHKEHMQRTANLERHAMEYKESAQSYAAEVADLTAQLKDTRRRLSRRVRELEETLAEKELQLSTVIETHKKTAAQLRAECDMLRAGIDRSNSADAKNDVVCSIRDNGSVHNVNKEDAETNVAVTPICTRVPDRDTGGPLIIQSPLEHAMAVAAAAKSPGVNLAGSTPVVSSKSENRPKRLSRPSQSFIAGRPMSPSIHSSNKVSPPQRRPTSPTRSSSRHSLDGASARDTNLCDPESSVRRHSSARTADGRRKLIDITLNTPTRRNLQTTGYDSPPLIRSRTRRAASVRQSFVAHIHSNRYRTMRVVWYDFLCAQGPHISRDQFLTVVRRLPGMADAREKDIDPLKDEVCGHSRKEEGITWAMFVRFYQKTKGEIM